MNRIILFFLFLSFITVSSAQDPGYDGKAKIAVQSFWGITEKLDKKIAEEGANLDLRMLEDNCGGLSRKIELIKKQDPAYNTASMETKLQALMDGIVGLKNKSNTAIQDRHDQTMNMQKAGKLLFSLFEVSVQVDNAALPTIKQKIEDYKKRTTDLLAMDRSMNKSDLEKQLKILKVNYPHADHDLNELDRRCREQTNTANAEVQYYELLFNQAHWDAAQQIYPDEPDFKKAYALATKLLQGLGNIDDVHNIASKSKQQKINDTRLPAPAIKDAALEKMFMQAFNKYHGEEFKGTATRAVITSDDWAIERNEITGIVTGRIRRAVIVFKDKDGKCYLTANFYLRQEYVGNSFSESAKSIYPIMGMQEMLCSNVK